MWGRSWKCRGVNLQQASMETYIIHRSSDAGPNEKTVERARPTLFCYRDRKSVIVT